MAHEKYSILKSCCRSNKTHQAAESTLCHHLHLGQARLQMQFPVWYLLSQMVSGKPGGDVLSSPHAVSSCFFFLGGGRLATMSHHCQIYSTQDPVGFVYQFSSKTQLPSFRKGNWNFKSNVNKRAKELEQKEIENSDSSRKISNGRGQSVVSGFFLF